MRPGRCRRKQRLRPLRTARARIHFDLSARGLPRGRARVIPIGVDFVSAPLEWFARGGCSWAGGAVWSGARARPADGPGRHRAGRGTRPPPRRRRPPLERSPRSGQPGACRPLGASGCGRGAFAPRAPGRPVMWCRGGCAGRAAARRRARRRARPLTGRARRPHRSLRRPSQSRRFRG